MPKTEVILTHNIVGLGGESDQVKVAPGYARNYLFPQRLAIPLTSANKRRIEALRQRRAEREAHELNTMTELSKSLSKLFATVTVKTGDDGKMFGTVTSGMIADQLKTQFDVTLDKKKIHLEHPIKTLGDHEVELRLHPDVVSRLKVRVESSTASKPADGGDGTGTAAGGREPIRTESRGKRAAGDRAERSGAPEKGASAGKPADRTVRTGKVEPLVSSDKGAKTEKSPAKGKPHKDGKK